MNPRYVAMWSGPRNISTAMMRSWGNRPDTFAHDEPFYAHYLLHTHHRHPGAEEIIVTYETDWERVVQLLTGPVPGGKQIYYQKHMTHHLLDHMDIGWVTKLTNCFLIREPREMLTSLIKVFPNPDIDQTGLPQQRKLFDFVRESVGVAPPVINARDVLEDPRRILRELCAVIGVPFYEEMLFWGPGKRETDGIWAKYWYAAVEQSTGFAPYQPKTEQVPAHLGDLLEECEALYSEMYAYRIGG